MPIPRLTVNAVVKLAQTEASRLAAAPVSTQMQSPQLSQAIELVWDLVRQRLGNGAQVETLDKLIRQITTRRVDGR